MAWLIGVSMRFGRLVVAAALGLLVLAFVQLRGAPVDVYPELMPPAVQIQTEALGLSAAEIEQLVTVPLEQDLLNGVPWLDHISSKTSPGLSTIDLVFVPGTEIYAARQMVQERLSQAHVLPNVGSAPIMIQPLASASRVAMVGLRSADVSLVDMSVLARWKIRPRLMGVPGVANVSVYGQRDRQLQVQVDPAKINAAGVSLTQVIETAGNALWVSPLSFVEASTPGTGGFIEGTNQRLAIQHVLPIRTPEQLAAVPVEGTPAGSLRLGDVATVVEDHQPLIGDALVDGAPSLYLVIDKFPGANTLEVTRGIEDAMAGLAPGLSGITVDTSVYRPAGYLQNALGTLGVAALLGLLLMLGALFLVLSSWRAVAVTAGSVLVSLAAAAVLLSLVGATFTTMTLLGFAAALAFVVDDGVRDVEAVRGVLRSREAGSDVRPDPAAVASACLRNRSGLGFVLLAVLVATVPLLVMGRLTTAFTRPLVGAYAVALVGAVLVALVVTPTMAVLLLRGTPAGLREGPVSRFVHRRYDRRTQPAGTGGPGGTPRLAWAVAAVLALGCLVALPQLGQRSLLPAVQDRNLLVHLDALPGTSLTEMDRVTNAVAAELRRVPGVGDVGAHVGRAVTSDQDVDVNSAEVWLQVEDQADYAATTAAVDTVVHAYPGIRGSLVTYTGDRVVAATDPTGDDLVVRVYGQDLTTLRDKATELRKAVAGVDGVSSTRIEPLVQQPVAHIEVNLDAAAKAGLRPGDVRRDATTLTSGLIVGSLYEEAKIFDVVVWGGPSMRQSVTALQGLMVDTPAGGQVRLGDIASVRVAAEPVAIEHHEVSRSVDVVLGLNGRSPAAVAEDVRARIAAVAMPFEYHAEVVGGAPAAADDLRRTLAYALGALVVVYLLLQAATRSWRRPALLLLMVPLAVSGAVVAAAFVGGMRTVGPLAALFAVAALAVRHGVMLMRATDQPGVIDLTGQSSPLVQATRSQLVPVLATALATGALLLPVAVLGDRPGTEILQPFAVAFLGGLVSCTAVLLLVLPAFLGRARGPQPPVPAATADESSLAPATAPSEGIGT